MKEIWKPIKGYELTYEVSNLGNVRSKDWMQKHSVSGGLFLKKGKPISIRFGSTWNGYSSVSLKKNNKQVSLFLHRVIGEAFIPNPDNKPFINHKNGIKTDNRVSNLEWCTRSENAKHSFKIGLQCNKGQNHPRHKVTDKDVLKMRERYANGESSWKIFKSMNMSYTNVKDIIAGRSWSHLI